MVRYNEAKRQACQSALKGRVFPQSIDEHATQLEDEFTTVNDKFIKSPRYCIRWSKSTKKLVRDGVEEAVDNSIAIHAPAQLSEVDKNAFSILAITKIGTKIQEEILPSVPEAEFIALHRSYQDLVHKIRALQPTSSQHDSLQKDLSFKQTANLDEDEDSSDQVARLSLEYIPLGSFDENSTASKARSIQVGQSGIRLQGSVDWSTGQEDESDRSIDGRTECSNKEENYNEATAIAWPNPATFTKARRSALALPPPVLPLPESSNSQDRLTTNPSIAPMSQIVRETTSSTNTESTLLQLADELGAFVAAREVLREQIPRKENKRKAIEAEYLMSGALQTDGPERKRIKKENEEEEEGPVWPMGYDDYEPPSLKKKDVGWTF